MVKRLTFNQFLFGSNPVFPMLYNKYIYIYFYNIYYILYISIYGKYNLIG